MTGSFPGPMEAVPNSCMRHAHPLHPFTPTTPLQQDAAAYLSKKGILVAMGDFSRVRKELNECARDQKSGVTAT